MSRFHLRARRRLAHAARVRELEHELAQQALVLRINNLLATHLEPEALFEAISSVLYVVTPASSTAPTMASL